VDVSTSFDFTVSLRMIERKKLLIRKSTNVNFDVKIFISREKYIIKMRLNYLPVVFANLNPYM